MCQFLFIDMKIKTIKPNPHVHHSIACTKHIQFGSIVLLFLSIRKGLDGQNLTVEKFGCPLSKYQEVWAHGICCNVEDAKMEPADFITFTVHSVTTSIFTTTNTTTKFNLFIVVVHHNSFYVHHVT